MMKRTVVILSILVIASCQTSPVYSEIEYYAKQAMQEM